MNTKKHKKILNTKKSQVALEFIHTYGWVLISVTVVAGALIYFNLTGISHIIPLTCTFLSGINCLDSTVEDNLVSIVVLNEFGFALSNVSLTLTGTCNTTANTTDGNIYNNLNVLLTNKKATYVFECQNLSGLQIEEKINITYVNIETNQEHIKVGKLEYSPKQG